MTDRQYQEKDEKDEKERSKHEEKTAEEKWRRDPLGSIVWALILIWAGLVFLAENMGLLARMPVGFYPPGEFVGFYFQAWPLVFLGAGVLILFEVLVRYFVPTYRQPLTGKIVLAAIFIGIGLGDWFRWDIIWPLIIIAVGLSIVLRSARRGPS
jgi:hypothetical protein